MTKKENIEKDLENSKDKLSAKQEAFCQLYCTDVDFFGNWTRAYLKAYDLDPQSKKDYNNAMASSSRLLRNVKIIDRIDALMEEGGLNDQYVDKQLLFLIRQHEDKGSKLRAIAEYNKLKQRITEKKEIEVRNPYQEMSTEELLEELEKKKRDS